MCLLKDFISVLALNMPLIVRIEDKVIYGRCYKGADRDNSFDVFSIDELFDKYGDYKVFYSCIINSVFHIFIKRGNSNV